LPYPQYGNGGAAMARIFRTFRNSQGFTLIELLIVVAVASAVAAAVALV
jgi:prepilin-type N-terminal cleavage/methylation domain-containing protein